MTEPAMDCREALELLHDELDGRLDAARRGPLGAHVAACAACWKARRQLAELRRTFHAVPPVAAPAGFTDGVMDRLSRGRILSFPRIAFPVAAAAALLLGAIVIANLRGAGERMMASAEKSAGPELLDGRTGSVSPGVLAAREALDADRRSRRGAPEDGEDEKLTAGPAATDKPAGQWSAETKDDAAKHDAKGASAESEGGASGTSRAAPAKDLRKAEDKVPAELSETVTAAAIRPAATVVVFRTEAEANAFLAALARPQREADIPPSGGGAGGASGGRAGSDSDPRGPVAGGGAGGGGADEIKKARDAGAGQSEPASDPQAAADGSAGGRTAAPRVVRRVVVSGDAWAAHAASLGGRVLAPPAPDLDGDGVPAIDDGALQRVLADAERTVDDPTRSAAGARAKSKEQSEGFPGKDEKARDAPTPGAAAPGAPLAPASAPAPAAPPLAGASAPAKPAAPPAPVRTSGELAGLDADDLLGDATTIIVVVWSPPAAPARSGPKK